MVKQVNILVTKKEEKRDVELKMIVILYVYSLKIAWLTSVDLVLDILFRNDIQVSVIDLSIVVLPYPFV